MTLKFASSLGEVHSGITDTAQMDRYFGAAILLEGVDAGLMSNDALISNFAQANTPVFTEQDTWITGAAILPGAYLVGGGSPEAGFKFQRQGVTQLTCTLTPRTTQLQGSSPGQYYSMEVRRGATVLGTTGFIFYSQEWTVFQIEATIDPTVGAFELQAAPVINGQVGAFVTVLTQSGVNTADDAVAGADQVSLNWTINSGNVRWDHWWVFDDQGTVNDALPPKWLLVQGVVPNANGAQNDWIVQGGQGTGFETVNDPGFNTGDDVGRHTAEDNGDIFITEFQIPGETGSPGSEVGHPISSAANVLGLIFHHVSAMENSGSRNLRRIYRDIADVRNEGPDVNVNTTTFEGFFEVLELNPISAAAWTAQQTREMQWGLKLQS